MAVIGACLSVLGLIFNLIAGLILLPKIFVTDQEIELLAGLPIEESTSHMTGTNSRRNLPVAVTDVEKLKEYRQRFIEARKEERKNGGSGPALDIRLESNATFENGNLVGFQRGRALERWLLPNRYLPAHLYEGNITSWLIIH